MEEVTFAFALADRAKSLMGRSSRCKEHMNAGQETGQTDHV